MKNLLIVVTGKSGCGKTKNKQLIACMLGCNVLVDGLSVNEAFDFIEENYNGKRVLILTSEPVVMDPSDSYVSAVHHYSSLGFY